MTAHFHALPRPGGLSMAEAASRATPLIRPARLDDVRAILALHREAFADKFGGAFGPGRADRGVAALAAAWQRQGIAGLRGMLVAEQGGAIIGTASLRTWEMSANDGGAAEIAFHEELGLWGATRSLFALSLLDHPIDRNEGFISDVAVLPEHRRGGVAQALLAQIERDALARSKRFLGLYVSARNEGARALYRRIGFYDVRVRRSFLARLFFGQGRWVYMRKDLAPA